MAFDAGLIVAFVTALAGLLIAAANWRKAHAETERTASDIGNATTAAVLLLLKPLNERVAALECEVATLRHRVAEFRRGVKLLCGQLTTLGATPVWQSDEGKGDD